MARPFDADSLEFGGDPFAVGAALEAGELADQLRHLAGERRLLELVEAQRRQLLGGDTDGELEALAAHRLDQHRQVQFAAARNAEAIRIVGVLDAQRDVVFELLVEALANLAARQVLALAARKRRLVDLEGHADRRFIDLERG